MLGNLTVENPVIFITAWVTCRETEQQYFFKQISDTSKWNTYRGWSTWHKCQTCGPFKAPSQEHGVGPSGALSRGQDEGQLHAEVGRRKRPSVSDIHHYCRWKVWTQKMTSCCRFKEDHRMLHSLNDKWPVVIITIFWSFKGPLANKLMVLVKAVVYEVRLVICKKSEQQIFWCQDTI